MDLRNGNCLELLKTIPDKSVDLFICDLPYGETNCKWDCKIDLVEFWKEFKRVRKSKKTACIHFCSTKFGYTLIKSNEKMYKMDMVWKKRNKTGGLQSRHRPMRNHEMVYFFYDEAPKYNRDKYHKRIKPKKEHNIEKEEGEMTMGKTSEMKNTFGTCFEPPNPASVLEDKKSIYGCNPEARHGKKAFEPPNPASVLEADGTELYGHNNKSATGWDKSASAFYNKDKKIEPSFDPKLPTSVLEEAKSDLYKTPKKKRDTQYSTRAAEGKDIFGNNDTRVKPFNYEPPNPASVLEEKDEFGWDKSVVKEKGTKFKGSNFEPVNPVSVIEEKDQVYGKACGEMGFGSKEYYKTRKEKGNFEPSNPASVLEEEEPLYKTSEYTEKVKKGYGYETGPGIQKNKKGDARFPLTFDPPNPASVLEEKDAESNKLWGYNKPDTFKKDVGGPFDGNNQTFTPPNPVSVLEEKADANEAEVYKGRKKGNKCEFGYDAEFKKLPFKNQFDPKLPASVLEEEYIEAAEDEPWSMFESTKVFIGKRHHQTEKPLDILEFFLKYWTNDNDTILDPTMGSGSTGVACKQIGNRNFIGFELDPNIYETAKKRCGVE